MNYCEISGGDLLCVGVCAFNTETCHVAFNSWQ